MRLSLEGADGITLTESGDLTVRVGGTEVRLRKPVVYQNADAGRVEIPGTYQLAGASKPTVRFQLGDYDPSLPLVIDPTWMTTFGSTSEDGMTGFEVDSAGQPRLLGMTFDPASFPFNDVEPGVLPPPNCFLTKLDASSGLRTYTILFKNTASCENLALAPSNVTYFTGFVYPNGFPNNRGTTVTAVDDSSGVPVVSRFVVGNYDSSPIGEGVDAIAVNGLGHVFLLGPCRLLDPGEPALELSGYNETFEPAHDVYEEGCRPASPGLTSVEQPLLTVVDNSGEFLYGSFLSPGELVTKYALAADDADRAYILGAQLHNGCHDIRCLPFGVPIGRNPRIRLVRLPDGVGHDDHRSELTPLCQLPLEHGECRDRRHPFESGRCRDPRERGTSLCRLPEQPPPEPGGVAVLPLSLVDGRHSAGPVRSRRDNRCPESARLRSRVRPVARGRVAGRTDRARIACGPAPLPVGRTGRREASPTPPALPRWAS